MNFKNYKSSELYILLNLFHLISIPSYLSSIYHAPWHYPPVPHPSLSRSLASSDAPTTACTPTPPPSLQHAPVLGPPSLTAAARTPPRQRVPPPTFPSIFLLHAWPQHICICAINEARQSTHRGNIHFYHLPCKQARHISNMHIPPACKAQAHKCQQCTHTCTYTDSSCMHAN
jgi:hypothetical protein